MLKIVYIHLYNIFVSLLLKCGLDLSWRRYFISENMATCSLIATGLIFCDLRPMWYNNGWVIFNYHWLGNGLLPLLALQTIQQAR